MNAKALGLKKQKKQKQAWGWVLISVDEEVGMGTQAL